jgi:hypothetical protein
MDSLKSAISKGTRKEISCIILVISSLVIVFFQIVWYILISNPILLVSFIMFGCGASGLKEMISELVKDLINDKKVALKTELKKFVMSFIPKIPNFPKISSIKSIVIKPVQDGQVVEFSVTTVEEDDFVVIGKDSVDDFVLVDEGWVTL